MKKLLLLIALFSCLEVEAQIIGGVPRRSGGGGGSFEVDPTVPDAVKIIDAVDISNWKDAYLNVHTHSNKAILDAITSTDIANWTAAYSAAHSHSNKVVLDNIGAADTLAWATAYDWGNHASAGYAPVNNATLTGTITLPTTTSIGSVSSTEISYLDGVTTSLQANIDARAFSNSPTLTGTPTAPTATPGTNTTQIATTAFVTAGLATKEGTVTAGTAGQYYRGDKTWVTFPAIPTNSDYVDLSSNQASISGNKGFLGTITTAGIMPSANGTIDLGSPSIKFANVYTNRVNAVGTLSLISSGSNAILFSQSSPTSNVVGGFAATSGVFIVQAPGTSLTASTGELAQIYGTAKITGATSIGGNLSLSSIPTYGSKASTFLVSNGGVVSSRTGAQLYADITEVQSFRREAMWEAQGNGSTVNSSGLALTAEGTATARAVATTNFYTSMRRLNYVGATTANAPAGLRGNNAQFQVARGFSFRAVFGIRAYNAGHRYYIGMGEDADNTVDPSALVNRLNMYADPGDVTWKVRGANASQGTAIDLGANFPVNTSETDFYDVTFICDPGATTATYIVRRLNTGDAATGTISTVPGAVLIRPQVIAGNAATGTAASIDIARMAVITDN